MCSQTIQRTARGNFSWEEVRLSRRVPAMRKAASPETDGCIRNSSPLLRDAVRPLASFVLRGLDRESYLLRQRPADEAADAVVLPRCGLGDLCQRGSVGAAQEVQHD